jgi:Tol biopolymer transport system component
VPLQPGTTLGPYQVTAKIGEGGMGEVYQARDTKLDRDVALKVLPEAFTSDPDRLARFEREAKVLASLNHPNIGSIYGLEEAEGVKALVLELIEGPTLADRIAQGPIPVDEALPIARQIAEALEAAHEAGVIHRDLKPANIKVRDDGTVKVLDFGLAKAFDPSPTADPDQSPTLTAAATQMGVIMGTAAYMSPEQARGKPVDKRADIWAFGAVLYEMLTGRRAFEGEDVSLTMSAVLQREPDWRRLPGELTTSVRTFLRRCLEKDPRERVRDIGDVRLALAGAFETLDGTSVEPAVVPRLALWQRPVPLMTGGLLALVVAAAGGALGTRVLGPIEPEELVAPTQYLELVLDDPAPMGDGFPVISPDGRLIAYAGASETQPGRLYIRSVADGTTRPVPGSERAMQAAFDPQGRSVAYAASAGLWVWEIGDALPERIAPLVGLGYGIAWLADGTIVVSASGSRHPQRFRAVDGTPVPLEIRAEGADDLTVSLGGALLGSETLLVSIRGPTTDGPRVAALSLADGTLTDIAGGSSPSFVAPSTLVFLQQGALVAAPFDPATMELTGPTRALSPPGTVTTTVRWDTGDALMAAVHPGGLALLPMDVAPPGRLVWVDRDGRETLTGFDYGGSVGPLDLADVFRNTGVRLSPDGRRAAVVISAPIIVELDDVTRLRPLPLQGMATVHPRWDPRGEHIVVTSNQTGPLHGYRLATSGGSEPVRFTEQPQSIATSFFPDGESMLGYVVDDETLRDLWVFHLDGQDEPLLQTAANERAPMLAADGRAYVYVSDASGADRIYLQRYPDDGQALAISGDGAAAPLWSRDGREVFFVLDGRLMAVAVDLSERIPRPSSARELFAVGLYDASELNGTPLYDVAEDGRFLMLRPPAGSRTWRFIQNWGASLDALLAEEQ